MDDPAVSLRKHARSGSDKLSTATYPLGTRPHRFGPLRSYLEVIFMRFRGPKALNDKLPAIRSKICWASTRRAGAWAMGIGSRLQYS